MTAAGGAAAVEVTGASLENYSVAVGGALVLVLVAGIGCGVRGFLASLPPGAQPSPRLLLRPAPWATIAGLAVIGVVSTLQVTVAPGLLDALERDAAGVSAGQVWRLGTALLTQDGAVAGLVFNLACLAVLGTLAERVLGHGWAVASWASGALVGELVGLAWQPVGAGNSVGNLGLVGALTVAALAFDRRGSLVPAAVVVVGGLVLLAGTDIHGAALAAGALAGAVRLAVSRGTC